MNEPPSSSSNGLCVVHLVRRCNGTEPLRRFLAAYQRCPGGVEHDFLLLCKGFDAETLPQEFLELLDSHRHRTVFVDDTGFDIGPYFAAAACTTYRSYCFLNSFSEPLDSDWLRKLQTAQSLPGMCAVGATGSAESGLTALQTYGWPPARVRWRQPLKDLRYRWEIARLRREFLPFPNYHLRSNAFLIGRERFLGLRRPIRNKRAAERFESGNHGLTASLRAQGYQVGVVGRDGICYPPERWEESRTFRSGEQENLLVADNRTSEYARAALSRRRELSARSWSPVASRA